jgi:hypothetical protein
VQSKEAKRRSYSGQAIISHGFFIFIPFETLALTVWNIYSSNKKDKKD